MKMNIKRYEKYSDFFLNFMRNKILLAYATKKNSQKESIRKM